MNSIKNVFPVLAVAALAFVVCFTVGFDDADAQSTDFGTITYNSDDGGFYLTGIDAADGTQVNVQAISDTPVNFRGIVSDGTARCSNSSGTVLGESSYMVTVTIRNVATYSDIPMDIVQLTFNSNNGSGATHIMSVNAGDAFVLSDDFEWTNNGNALIGWATTADATQPSILIGGSYIAPSQGTTLYAVYGETTVTYPVNVEYTGDGSVTVDPQEASEGDPVTITATPNEGNIVGSVSVIINGSAVDVTDNNDGTYTFVMGAGPANVTVAFESSTPGECTVSFDANYDGAPSIESQTVPYGSTVTAPTEPEREGYNFFGWFTEATGGERYDFQTEVTNSFTLYAQWEQVTVTYDVVINPAEGGTVTADYYTVEAGGDVTLTITADEGYRLSSLTVDGTDVTEFVSENSYTVSNVSGDVNVIVVFEAITYQVTFDSQGGSAVDPQTVPYGDTASEPADPVWEHHAFTGWFTDADCTQSYDFATPVTGPVTLYAGWDIEVCTVIISVNDGGWGFVSQSSVDVPYETEYSVDGNVLTIGTTEITATPTDDDVQWAYGFGGWSVQSGTVDGDMEITALFTRTAQQYTVTFDSQGGSTVESQLVDYNSFAVEPEAPVLEHYDFTGWYADADCTQPYDFATPVTGSVTLYAGWSEHLYTVIWNADNESEPLVQYLQFGTVLVAPEDPVKSTSGDTQYHFHCWTNSDTGVEFAEGDTVTGDMSFIAHYIETVDFNGHSIELDVGIGGSVDFSPSEEDNRTAVLTVTPSYGFYMYSLDVNPPSGATVVYIENDGGVVTYEIRNITTDIVIDVMFMSIDSGDDDPVPNPPVVIVPGDDGNGAIIVAAAAAVLIIVFAAVYIIYGRKS